MDPQLDYYRNITRRHFFQKCNIGLGAIALNDALSGAQAKTPDNLNPLAPKKVPRASNVKNVIYIHCAGSPTQLELFDHKPELKKFDGKTCPKEYLDGKRFAFIQPHKNPVMMAGLYDFQQYGPDGTWMSSLLPNLSTVAGDLCVIRSMHTTQFNHAPAQMFLLTGDPRFGKPSIGSWVTYGLGSENQNLPGFIVLASGGKTPSSGKSVWGSGFLPSVYQGTQCRNTGDPILYLKNPKGMDQGVRRRMLDTLNDLNTIQHQAIGDPETLSRISQYELTFRMQLTAAEVMDISKEPQSMLALYGAGSAAAPKTDPAFANNCLLARRLVESGVRFVQLFDWGWDHHGSSGAEDMKSHLPMKTRQIDRPITGLIKDLKQRGLLDETLIVWGGEFGRTPMRENRGGRYGKFVGRDHHPFCFTMWMAGGGVKPGFNYGSSDEIGYYPAENKVTVRDLQATILHQLGLNPHTFSVPHQGLNERLIGPTDDADILNEILI